MRPSNLLAATIGFWLCLCSCGVSAERATGNAPAPQEPNVDKGVKAGQDAKADQGEKPKEPRAAVDPNKFAIVIAGVGGEETYSKRFTSQAAKLYEELTNKLGFAEKNVMLLTERVSAGPENDLQDPLAAPAVRSTAEEVRKAFAAVKAAAKADSLVLVVLIGHGSYDNQQPKFNLVGPDLTAKEYSQLLGSLPTRRTIFVNCASASGEFIKPLTAPGRIVITATRSGSEQNVTIFAEHFIAGLVDPAADADKNGRISVLEAFDYATKLTADWYKGKGRLATEHALIDDNGDGVGHESATAGDGALAKTTYLDSKPVEQAGGDAELAHLLRERQRLEEAVEKHKLRKAEMKPEEYENELERLLLELAKVNQAIKAKQK